MTSRTHPFGPWQLWQLEEVSRKIYSGDHGVSSQAQVSKDAVSICLCTLLHKRNNFLLEERFVLLIVNVALAFDLLNILL